MTNLEAFINQAKEELINTDGNAINEVITTFDGVTHDRDELLSKMYDDDFYYGYLGKHALSSSSLKNILKSPKIYKEILEEDQAESQALRSGKLFHWIILEPEKIKDLHIVEVASKNTKKFKEACLEHDNVFTRKEFDDMEKLTNVMLKNNKALDILKDCKVEVPEIKMIRGVAFRGKADIITNSGGIIDLKTTTQISKFKYSAKNFSYDLQCYVYCNLFNVHYKDFLFIAIDKESLVPKVCDISEEFYLAGEKKCEQAIQEYINNVDKDLNEYLIYDTL